MDNDNIEVGDKVTITGEGIRRTDWASIGITEDTLFTIAKIDEQPTSFHSPKVVLHDEDGEEYEISTSYLIFL